MWRAIIVTTGSQTLTVVNKAVIEVTNTITNNADMVAAYRARNIFNGNGNIVAGLDVVPTFSPTASISLAKGMVVGGRFAPPSGVTIANAFGGNTVTWYDNVSGAVTNGTTFSLSAPIVWGALKPTTQYGLRVENQGISGTTNSYGLYVDAQSGSTNNYAAIFAGGNVGIGTTSPAQLLHLNSAAANSSAIQLGIGGTTYGYYGLSGGTDLLVQGSALGDTVIRSSQNILFGKNSATAPFVYINSSGNVGIGLTTPGQRLSVFGTIESTSGGFKFPNGTLQTTAATVTSLTAGAGLTSSGTGGATTLDIGGGTGITVAADTISVNYGSGAGTAVQGNTSITLTAGDGMSGGGQLTLGSGGTLTLTNVSKGSDQPIFKNIADSGGTPQFSAISNNDALRFAGSGGTSVTFDAATKKVTIDGSTSTPSAANISAGQFGQNTGGGNYIFPGNVTVNGNIAAKYQDMAEWVPSSEQLSSGTVVVLDSTKSNHVISSTQPYDTRVAGVISEQPGIALGEGGAGKVLVATTGRVLVQVDASKSPIHIGDLLVTSDAPGMAMKSEPLNVGRVQLHRPGTLIGKALEPLERGTGKILVLLSLQ
jgi:hypothetical protein